MWRQQLLTCTPPEVELSDEEEFEQPLQKQYLGEESFGLAAELPEIDLHTDKRIFALLDDCCNSAIHTTALMKKAAPIFKRNWA